MFYEENIANIEVQLKFWDSVSRNDFDEVDHLLAGDYVEHETLPTEFPQNRRGFIQFMTALRGAFADAQFEIQNIFSNGEMVCDQVVMTGTQTGEIFGLLPTGNPVRIELMDMVHCTEGKVVEHWGLFDRWTLSQQLDLLEPAEFTMN
jgi:predicted ester cyclase